MAYTVLACTVTPPHQIVPKEELVSRTKTIVLAEAVKEDATPGGGVKYTFKSKQSIKGNAPETFTIDGMSHGVLGGDPGTFNDHQDPSFWDTPRGRCVHDTSCRINPSFIVGGSYLIFLDGGEHQKAFEKIEKIDGEGKDKWLTWVEQAVK